MSAENNPGGKLLSIESIFKWKPVIYEENLNEISCELEPQAKHEFNFFNLIIKIVQSYRVHTADIEAALGILDDLELSAKEFHEECDGGFFKKIQNAYDHMVYASKSFLLIKSDKHQEASVILEKIIPIDKMNDYNKAAILAMKSAVFAIYSNEDTQKAFASIDKALKLDPENGRYNFLRAFYLRKIRRMTNPFEAPSLQEKESFQKAFEYEPTNVVFKLYLADVYREISGHASKRQDMCSHFLPKDASLNDNLRLNIDEKVKLAKDYYKQAAEEYSDCPYVMFRCAEGLAKLPSRLCDIALAIKLTKEGLKKSPENIAGNLVMAFLLEKFDKNFKEAEKHLKVCQSKNIFDADINMIRLLHSTKPTKFNGNEALEILIAKYKEKQRQAILYCQMVSFYLFTKSSDLVKAIENAKKFFELNTTSSCMKVHRSCFIPTADPFSLIDVLTDEVKFVMNNKKTPAEVQTSCEKFVQFMNFQNIPIIKGFPQNFKNQILQGKPLTINPNCVQPSRKQDRSANRREPRVERDNVSNERKNQSTNNRPNTSNKPNSGGKSKNNSQPKNPTTDVNNLPSLMDNPVANPVTKNNTKQIEKQKPAAAIETRSEKSNDDFDDTEEKQLVEMILKVMKKEKQEKKSRASDEIDEESISRILKQMGFGDKKSIRDKKHHSDSDESDSKYRKKNHRSSKKHHSDSNDSDSEYKRRKYRRRERSRRRNRSHSDSDDSDRYSRRHHRRHKHHSSTDSESSSRSVRRKSHKKDRYERDYSPRDRRNRRNHSPDEDFGYNAMSSHRRDSVSPDRRRRGRKDSVSSRCTHDRSPSYDRHSKRRSPTKEKSSHRNASADRYSSPEFLPEAIDQRKPKQKSSGKRHSRDGSPYEKKHRRRSASRGRYEDYRSSKVTKSRKERDSESLPKDEFSKKTKPRDQNSPRRKFESDDESD